MQLNPSLTRRTLLIVTALALPTTLRAAEPALRDLLRDGLFAEEVSRDPEAAARQYEQVLDRYAEQRDFAASALFRLAEVRRKQDRRDDAIKLYQRLLTEFPGAANETKLARENLVAMGGRPPLPGEGEPAGEEAAELTRLRGLAKSAPDVLRDLDTQRKAAENGWASVFRFLLDTGVEPTGVALRMSASRGYLDVVKMLTNAKKPIPSEDGTLAITLAIESDRVSVLEYLLERGFKAGMVRQGDFNVPALSFALSGGKMDCAEMLLKHGADPNEMSPDSDQSNGSPTSEGSPLHFVISSGCSLATVEWLLKRGADPSRVDPTYGVSPLMVAAVSGSQESTAIVKRLLEAGADPNTIAKSPVLREKVQKQTLTSRTVRNYGCSLVAASNSNFQPAEKLKLLLDHKADPNLRIGTWTVNKGPGSGDPFDEGNKSEISAASTPLTEVANQKSISMVKLLLDAGAVPDRQILAYIISTIAESDETGEVVRQLIRFPHGKANPSQTPQMRDWTPAARSAFLDGAIYPELAAQPGIHLLMMNSGNFTQLKDGKEGGTVPDLASLLLDQWSLLSQPDKYRGDSNSKLLGFVLARLKPDGTRQRIPLDPDGRDPFPELQWNDVIEVTAVVGSSQIRNSNEGLNELSWALRKRISFPVTFEVNGTKREWTMRGDRVIFDPTKNEVPLTDAQGLVDLVGENPGTDSYYPPTLLITRKSWPEVRLAYGSNEARKFPLEPGDRVTLERPTVPPDDAPAIRQACVILKAEGLPFSRIFPISNGSPLTIPTLVQALVDSQTPPSDRWLEWRGKKSLGVGELVVASEVVKGFALLPFPDLSRIKVHRMTDDGTESVLEVDLAATIASTSDQTTVEDARAADVPLQAGDIVEIPLKKPAEGGAWKGYTEAQNRFFAKALSGKVQIINQQGGVQFSEIAYRAPEFITTEIGDLPVPAATGMPTARGIWIENNWFGEVSRGENRINRSQPFLRDGAIFRATGGTVVPGYRQPQPGQPQPGQPQPGQPVPQPRRIVRPPQ